MTDPTIGPVNGPVICHRRHAEMGTLAVPSVCFTTR
jgi:hypothetical protein